MFVAKMSKKEVLVEYITKINSIIKQSLHQTQRIKFTCFDLSFNYIAFGASSGGIYIFSRNPYKFIKLIPNKEGSVTNIVISPNEKDVALSTIKGLIVVIENCFCDSNIRYQIYTEHEGNNVTAMKWYLNDLYSGDNTGQISVIALTQVSMTKALFQTPSATLMRLDSSVVQLDAYSNFLLVSTKTRTYLCDTIQEQYRQIGKKLRDGNFGACFFYKDNIPNSKVNRNEEKLFFKTLREDEKLPKNKDVKIYCARPGSRLWEANFESSVICTHQFRDSLNKNASNIVHLNENTDSSLIVSNFSECVSYNFNFEKIFMFSEYILTFKIDGIYIFDVKTVSLLYWTNYFNNIKDIKIIENIIYIWLENNILKLLSLLDIESFITKVLSNKQYLVCAEFCKIWKSDVSVLIDDNRLLVLKVLNEKIVDKVLLNDIEPLLKKVKNYKIGSQKLQNGIYVVDNVHHRKSSSASTNGIAKILQNEESSFNNLLINVCDNEKIYLNGDSKHTNKEEIVIGGSDAQSDRNHLVNILNRQYQLNKVNSYIDMPKFTETMLLKSLDEYQNMFDIFLDNTKDEHKSKKFWFSSQILRYISLNISTYFENVEFDSIAFQFILNCFLLLNGADDLVCSCGFPLSLASLQQVQYYEIGCKIIDKHPHNVDVCKKVPSMYHFILEKKCEEDLILSLPLLLQYNDIHLFKKFCKKFTYDMWDDSINFLTKLKTNHCINCDNNINNKLNINWNDFSKCMLHSIGGSSTLELLTRHSHQIPPGELDTDFYQSCIFINCFQDNENSTKSKSYKFLQDVEKNEQSRNEFDLLILKYLNKKQVGDINGTNISYNLVDSLCSVCDISLKSSLFEDSIINLKCGHASHKICAINRDNCKNCYEIV